MNSDPSNDPAPSYNQIDEQLAAGQAASVLVERHDDSISVGQVAGRGKYGARVYFSNLNRVSGDDEAIATKVVPLEELSDSHQQKLAAELADVALRGEVDSRPRLSSWDQWKQGHPLSDQQVRAIDQSVRKNIELTKMYGSAHFNVKK